MFHPKTRTWSFCTELPFPLAYADVISTPKGAWILGGKKDPLVRASVMIGLIRKKYYIKNSASLLKQ